MQRPRRAGLDSFPKSFSQDQFVESEILGSTAKPCSLFLKVVHPPRRTGLQTTIIHAPTVKGLLADR